MPVIRKKHITRSMLREQPLALFVFGDNLVGRGFGGQAAEMRGEPNAVGVPTKRYPTMQQDAFLTDEDEAEVNEIWRRIFNKLEKHLLDGRTIVLPADGVGTGRAKLAEQAPRLAARLQSYMDRLY